MFLDKMSVYWPTVAVVLLCFNPQMMLQTAAEEDEHFLNEWGVEILGGPRVARDVADQYGFQIATTVIFAEQQLQLTRVKRHMSAREVLTSGGNLDDPEFSHQWYINQADSTYINRISDGELISNRKSLPDVSVLDVSVPDKTVRRNAPMPDLRVRDVWKKGITGKNIVITVIDDGLEWTHPDIQDNYDQLASADFNENDGDPSPKYDSTNENRHGTRCAGVISMSANNNLCGAGIAFNSKIGGIRLLDGKITDHLEANSLAFKPHHIDIYSSSWGPSDDGKTVDGPRKAGRKALIKGVKEGRKGRGSLFVWASGNGGHKHDNCNADGYIVSIEVISVSSSSQDGKRPFYSEKCASTLTTSYSSGSAREGRVVSTDLHHLCTERHTGTSAASPMVAGIIALLLEIKYRNGAGYCVNLAFGFGLVDALAVVELGDPKTWKNVDEQRECIVKPVASTNFPYTFKSGQYVEIVFQTDGCAGLKNEINYLEHIQIVFNVDHERRGRVYAEVETAMGTVTPLMFERKFDNSTKGFKNWPLMSRHSWGEQPQGMWKFRVGDRSPGNVTGTLKNATLVLYGTKFQPEYRKTWSYNCSDVARLDHDRSSMYGK